MAVISVCDSNQFAFEITFKTVSTTCSTAVKRQFVLNLWSTNENCLVSHNEGRVRMAEQQFV